MKTSPRRLALLAGATALALLLSGCVGSFLPHQPNAISTPTNEQVAQDLKPFYSQVLRWRSCDSTFQCATAKAPLDWKNPAEGEIDLALIRSGSTGKRLGSLLVNPGGPGASGVAFVRDSLSYAVDVKLRANYDIVGFDPRGVGESSAVKCYTDPAEMTHYIYDILPGQMGSDAWIAEQESANADFAKACAAATGALLGQVDTVSAARDLDLLRAVLGDRKLNYLGYSYGTLLGATYAGLYPKNTGRLVLDGVVDPAASNFDITLAQAKGFERNLRAYLADCLKGSGCPFRGSVDSAMSTIRQVLQSLAAKPIAGQDGRQLGASAMFTAIIFPLYNKSSWPALSQMFTQVKKGDADYALELADQYNGRNDDGTYQDNSTEAFISIDCLDYPTDSSIATMRSQAAQLEKEAPVLGPEMAWGGTSCYQWPYAPTRSPAPIAAKGSAPILVVGTTNDPATPYVWSKNLVKELQNGHLVTYRGDGHTAYNKSNSCVNDAVDDYLVDGTVPSGDPMC